MSQSIAHNRYLTVQLRIGLY